MHKRRFQIYPLWRAFSNLCVYGERFHRLRVDGRPKGIKKFPFTSVCVYNRRRVDGALATHYCFKRKEFSHEYEAKDVPSIVIYI